MAQWRFWLANWRVFVCQGVLLIASFLPSVVLSKVYKISPHSDLIGDIQVIETVYEDTFVALARLYNVAFSELKAANPTVDPWYPGEGTKVIIPSQHILPPGPRRGIVINLPEMRLYYYLPNSRLVQTHPVGIGKETKPTPTALTRVSAKKINPAWYVPQSIYQEHLAKKDPIARVVPPGPDNPLGRYAIRLQLPGYLIHGTNAPPGVGQRISHGCIRMYPEDIQLIFDKVPVGTPVRIINHPFKAGIDNGRLHVESHQPLIEYREKATVERAIRVVRSQQRRANHQISWPVVRMMKVQQSGIPHDVGPLL